MRSPFPIATFALLTLVPARAQEPVSLVRVGDAIPGAGHVARIERLFAGSTGGWAVQVWTDHPTIRQVVLGPGGVLRKVGDPVPSPAGAALASFGSISEEELMQAQVWTAALDGTGAGTDAIYEDLGGSASHLLIQSGGATSGSTGDFPPGTIWTSFADYQGPGYDGASLLRGTVADPTLPAPEESFVARAFHYYFGYCCSIDLVAQEGRTAPGLAETIEQVRLAPWSGAIDPIQDSRVLWSCDLAGPTSSDGCVFSSTGTPAGYVDALLAREGSPSPVPGRTWGALESPSVDVNQAGRWSLRAELDASDTSSDGIVLRDGLKFVQEGDALPVIAPFSIDDLGQGRALLAPDGKLLWYAHWNDPSGSAEGLLLEQWMVVRAGSTTVAGVPIVDLASDEHAFTLSRNGQRLLFRGARAGGAEEAFLLDLGGMAVYCTSKPTSQSCLPKIHWTGSLPSASQGSGFVLRAEGTPAQALGLFLYGTSGPAALPFHHATLCVATPITRVGAAKGGGTAACFGNLQLDFNKQVAKGLDPALIAGQWVHAQFWFRDVGYAPPDDFGLTQGLEFYLLP
jgi:hypothetical protein